MKRPLIDYFIRCSGEEIVDGRGKGILQLATDLAIEPGVMHDSCQIRTASLTLPSNPLKNVH